MAKLLKGIDLATKITNDLIFENSKLNEKGLEPCLAILRLGENPDDLSYEIGIEKRFAKIGIKVKKFLLDRNATQEEVLDAINKINNDNSIHSALLFRPFPATLDDTIIRNSLAIEKDVDGISDLSLASIFIGDGKAYPPCTAKACLELLKYYGYALESKNIVVLGRSLVIGKPVAMMLLKENATVTICHSRSKNIKEICKKADILIASVGKSEMIDDDYVSKGQIIIDVGINVDDDGKLKGDVNFDKVEAILEAISPVPRGVGSVTTSILAMNVIEACKRSI